MIRFLIRLSRLLISMVNLLINLSSLIDNVKRNGTVYEVNTSNTWWCNLLYYRQSIGQLVKISNKSGKL